MSDVRAKAQLDRLYKELPTIDCRRECSSSCGPINMSRVEWARIVKKLGYEPRMSLPQTNAEAAKPGALECPMLRGGICSVYHIRPLICRLWGVAEGLECPWGCTPEPGYLTKLEAFDFLLRIEAFSNPEQAAAIEQERERLRGREDLVEAVAGIMVQKPVKTDRSGRLG